MIDISTLIERGGVYFNLEGESAAEVLTSLINISQLPASVNRADLLKAVLERESLMPTALGNGIAIPHPRNCVLSDQAEERIVVGYPRHPVDYQALDKEPVSSLFLILSADQRSHLQILSQLSFVFHDQDFRKLLATKPQKEELQAAVKRLLGNKS
jgi:PTS system nitrogen regulatory IIA component